MPNYHPVRYPDDRTAIDELNRRLNQQLGELATELGSESSDFKDAANSLLGSEIKSGDDYLAIVRRVAIMDADFQEWERGGQILFDMNTLVGGEAFHWDDAHLMDFEMPEQNFYVHFGPEAAIRLERDPTAYFDGMYIRANKLDEVEGFNVTFVLGTDSVPGDASFCSLLLTSSRIAYGWVPFEAPISASLKQRGVAGEPDLLADPALNVMLDKISDIIGKLCAAEHTMSFSGPQMRH